MAKTIGTVGFEEASLFFHALQPVAPEQDIGDIIEFLEKLSQVHHAVDEAI
ncbi:hypothetical protein ACI0FS_13810 [Ochrobactrum quorumnocens]|uniref:hypothetical protein n=1 Tax=Ochrobactrum quorumnocens TaxID=271865 RepID=UPI003852324B